MKVNGVEILVSFSEVIAKFRSEWTIMKIQEPQEFNNSLATHILLYDNTPLATINEQQADAFANLSEKPQESRSDTWANLVERSEGICTSLCKVVGVSDLPEARMAILENLRELSDVVRLMANRAKETE